MVFHTADWHFGCSSAPHMPQVLGEFAAAAERERPDLILVGGDIWDNSHPSNESLRRVQEIVSRIARVCPVVLIAGNHDTPRVANQTYPIEILLPLAEEGLPVYLAWKYVDSFFIDYPEKGVSVQVIAVPHTPLVAEADPVVPDIEDEADHVILLAHGVAQSDDPDIFRMGQADERVISSRLVDAGWDFVALGHYHIPVRVAPGVWYCGSPDTIDFRNQPEVAKGYLRIDFAPQEASLVPLKGSPMELVTVDSMDAALKVIKAFPEGGRLRLVFPESEEYASKTLYAKAKERGVTLQLRKAVQADDGMEMQLWEGESIELGSLDTEWAKYAESRDMEETLKVLGKHYLSGGVLEELAALEQKQQEDATPELELVLQEVPAEQDAGQEDILEEPARLIKQIFGAEEIVEEIQF